MEIPVQVITANVPAPESPKRFNDRLRADFGEINGHQKLRVVWGMDESIKQWVGGEWICAYPSARMRSQKLRGYYLQRGETTRRLMPREAEVFRLRPGDLLIPDIEIVDRYLGYPAWVLECYYPPSYFGEITDWEIQREADRINNGGVDTLGAFPRDGRYLEGVKLTVEDGDELRARPLSEETYQLICAMVRGEERGLKALLELKYQQAGVRTDDDAWRQAVEEVFDGLHREVETITKNRVSV